MRPVFSWLKLALSENELENEVVGLVVKLGELVRLISFESETLGLADSSRDTETDLLCSCEELADSENEADADRLSVSDRVSDASLL